jgi:prepilin-type N-terminal cleavage/methylation domain-containing protein
MSILSSHARRRARSRRGYTAIEVLLAMTVLLISTAGVMSMQKAAIQGNQDARRLDLANSIARTWLDRLAADSTSWNANNGLAFTNWLGPLQGAGFQTPIALVAGKAVWSPAFDILGRDLTTPTDPATVFCTHVNISVVTSSGAPAAPVLIQATVLVFWPKSLSNGGVPATPLCGGAGTGVADVAAAEATTPGTYHMIYASESIRRSS